MARNRQPYFKFAHEWLEIPALAENPLALKLFILIVSKMDRLGVGEVSFSEYDLKKTLRVKSDKLLELVKLLQNSVQTQLKLSTNSVQTQFVTSSAGPKLLELFKIDVPTRPDQTKPIHICIDTTPVVGDEPPPRGIGIYKKNIINSAPTRGILDQSCQELLDEILKVYPKRLGDLGKSKARTRLKSLLAKRDDIILAATNYRAYCDANQRTGTEFVKQIPSFLGVYEEWLSDGPKPASMDDIANRLKEG